MNEPSTTGGAWTCHKCGCLIYAGCTHQCPSGVYTPAISVPSAYCYPCAEQAQRIAELEAAQIELLRENRSARVQVPLWKGMASAMVERAKRIRCQFGGDHSMADCRCDPHQLGDTVFTMQDELDRAVLTTDFEAKKRIAELERSIELWTLAGQNWERQKTDLEAALAERTNERDEYDAKLRAVEAAIAEVYPAWLDAEDYADAIRCVGQERDQFAAALIEAHNAIEQCRDTEDCPDCGDYMAGCELDPKATLAARLAAERKAGAYAALTEARRRLCAEWGFVQCADSILDLRAEVESGEVKP